MNSPSVFYGMAESETRTSVLPAETVASRPDSQATSTGVVILDGTTRSALAATRSLGRKGVPVVVGGETSRTQPHWHSPNPFFLARAIHERQRFVVS